MIFSTGAKDILNAYIDSIGGKPTPKQQKTPAKRGAKRKSIPAQDTANAPASTTKKRARKSSNAVDTPKTVSRPEGTWEDDVQYIDCIEENEEEDGGISAFVVWNDDTKSRYSIKVVRQKCPQKVSFILLLLPHMRLLLIYHSSSLTTSQDCTTSYSSPRQSAEDVPLTRPRTFKNVDE
jgi:hypothetical protein